ncbi:MAG TPA: glycosyltransferase family 4 protein [Bacteroidota bacterium]|nr:glycosyltransferase family 4 protein [Bacteroidota bacterium]
MKILIFNWQDIRNPQAGGAEVHLHQIFSRIARMGHSVTLFCSSFPGGKNEETVDGIRIIREGGRTLFNLHVPLRYLRQFRKEAFDIVVDDFNKVPFFTPLFVRKPLWYIVHHLFGTSIFREVNPLIGLPFYLVEHAGIVAARIFHIPLMVVSPSTRDEMLGLGFPPDRLEIVYNCVDHDLHRPDPSQRSTTPVIASFGRLKKYKSVDHLLRAVALLKNRIPGLKVLVIGEGDYRPSLEALSRELQISDMVQFTGFVDEHEKVRLLQESWFAVNTSPKEGWGLTVIESNACGTPVLASNVPGLRDAINDGETGMLYEYGNISQLAEKIAVLVQNQTLRLKLAEQAYTWSRKFDWDLTAEKALGLLENRVKKSESRRP